MSKESKKREQEKRRARRRKMAEKVKAAAEATAMAAATAREAAGAMAALESKGREFSEAIAAGRNREQALLNRAELAERQNRELVSANVGLEQQLRAAEQRAADRDNLAAEVENFRADDRDVKKLRRRLQEQGETLERTRVELAQAKAKIPPAPLVLGGGMPAQAGEVAPAESPAP